MQGLPRPLRPQSAASFGLQNPHCHELGEGAPSLEECLCDECKEHFEGLKQLLTAAGVEYEVDHNLVRGLDYYTKTAFEIQ